MKKFTAFLTMALILSMCSTTIFAARHTNGKYYVDADGNGICDNYASNCNGYGKHSGCGKEYVDADGDGICDNMKYAVTYNLNGGKNNKKNPSCYYNTTNTIKLKNPTKEGYTFKGWYADKQCTIKVTAIKKGSSGNKTLYAKWQKK